METNTKAKAKERVRTRGKAKANDPPVDNRSIVAQVTELANLSVSELKTKWTTLFGRPPHVVHRQVMISRIAYRIQELAYGGLSDETKARLEEIAAQDELLTKGHKPRKPTHTQHMPIPGTMLIREHLGKRHEVTVVQEGFEYGGKLYRSLSAIAKHITGAHWNGWHFFGLRGKGRVATEAPMNEEAAHA